MLKQTDHSHRQSNWEQETGSFDGDDEVFLEDVISSHGARVPCSSSPESKLELDMSQINHTKKEYGQEQEDKTSTNEMESQNNDESGNAVLINGMLIRSNLPTGDYCGENNAGTTRTDEVTSPRNNDKPLPSVSNAGILIQCNTPTEDNCGEINEVMPRDNDKSDPSSCDIGNLLQSNALKELKKIHKKNPSVLTSIDADGNTLLHLATEMGYKDVLRWLLRRRIGDIQKKNNFHDTCTSLATKHGNLVFLKIITKHGHGTPYEILKSRDPFGQTVLHQATSCGLVDVVKWAVTQEWSLAQLLDCDGRTPLHLAALMGHAKIAKCLVEAYKQSTTTTDRYGASPLYYSASEGHVACVRRIHNIKNRMVANKTTGFTPLHIAAINGHVQVVKVLVEHSGAKCLRLQTREGSTVFHLAAENGHTDILTYLASWKQSKKAAVIPNNNGILPLRVASLSRNVECATLLAKMCGLDNIAPPGGHPGNHGSKLNGKYSRDRKPSRVLTPSLFRQKHRPSPLSLPEKTNGTVIKVEQSLNESIDADSVNWNLHSPLAVIQDYNGFSHGSRKYLSSESDWGSIDDLLNSNFILKKRPSDDERNAHSVDSESSDCNKLQQTRDYPKVANVHGETSTRNRYSPFGNLEGDSERRSSYTEDPHDLETWEENSHFTGNPAQEDVDVCSIASEWTEENALLKERKEVSSIIPSEYSLSTSPEVSKHVVSEQYLDCSIRPQTVITKMAQNNATNNNVSKDVPSLTVEGKSAPDGQETKGSAFPPSPNSGRRNFRLNYGAYTKAMITRRDTKSRVAIVYTDDDETNSADPKTWSSQGNAVKGSCKTVIHVKNDNNTH